MSKNTPREAARESTRLPIYIFIFNFQKSVYIQWLRAWRWVEDFNRLPLPTHLLPMCRQLLKSSSFGWVVES